MVMHDSKSERPFTYAVQKKGSYEALVKLVVQYLDRLGYKRMIMKCDQENSIEELCTALTRNFSGEVVPERVPVGKSQSNARVERCIRTMGGRIWTLKDALEFKLKCIIPATHPVMQWIVKWASFTHSECQVKRCGKTPYEKLTGHEFNKKVAQIGESILYKERRKAGAKQEKLDVLWLKGTYLGVDPRAEEVLVGTAEGVITAHSVRRRPESERWVKDDVLQVVGVPEEPVPGENSIQPPIEIRCEIESETPARAAIPRSDHAPQVRGIKLYKADFVKHGYSILCGGCNHAQGIDLNRRQHTTE